MVPHGHLTSVGIDIGSSTAHLMFSELTVGYPTAHRRRPEVLSRRVLSRSPIRLTPFTDGWRIDAAPLRVLVQQAFDAAQLRPEQIDTGAVIITGEAARRDNAQAIAEVFSDETGRFVCATAGPRLEALMAAHGSGAAALSREHGLTILHVDIGGGTTKVNLIQRGTVVETTAVNVGARLLAYDAGGRLERREPAGTQFLRALGATAEIGHRIDEATRDVLAQRMAACLFGSIHGEPEPWEGFHILPGLTHRPTVDGLLFSGGVAEYIYGRETTRFGDLGPYLGRAVRDEAARRGWTMLPATEGIRATVIGASAYSLQLSGETIFLPDAARLPMRNLRACVAQATWEQPIVERSERAIREALARRDAEELGLPFALVITSPPFYGYGAAQDLAEGIRRALRSLSSSDRPQLLVFSENVGQSVGSVLASELDLPCIDEIALSELDFIDVGRPVTGEAYVPVVVKSLAFAA